MHGRGVQGKSFASNWTREPSFKSRGSMPQQVSLRSRRGGGSVAGDAAEGGKGTSSHVRCLTARLPTLHAPQAAL